MHFVSATTGWGTTDTALVRSTDAGATWHAVTPAGLTIKPLFTPAADSLDADHAWVADAFQSPRPGIFHTTDGGRTWQHATLPVPLRSAGPLGVGQIDFVDSQHGWALEDLGGGAGSFYFALFRTTDGGAHWSGMAGGTLQEPPAPGAYPRNVQAIHFDSTSSGWTSVVIYAGPQLSGIYHTSDGGHVWRKVALPQTGAFSGGFFGVLSPDFFDARHGTLAVAAATAVGLRVTVGLYITGDGGITWAPTSPLTVKMTPGFPGQFSADIVDASHVWVIAGSHLYFTADLGRHWSLVRQSLGFGTIATIDYVTAQMGWALGGALATGPGGASHTALRRTMNGGHNWTILHPTAS
jgi:photosystem II stability/assembly factor-like uncharacterized protein